MYSLDTQCMEEDREREGGRGKERDKETEQNRIWDQSNLWGTQENVPINLIMWTEIAPVPIKCTFIFKAREMRNANKIAQRKREQRKIKLDWAMYS